MNDKKAFGLPFIILMGIITIAFVSTGFKQSQDTRSRAALVFRSGPYPTQSITPTPTRKLTPTPTIKLTPTPFLGPFIDTLNSSTGQSCAEIGVKIRPIPSTYYVCKYAYYPGWTNPDGTKVPGGNNYMLKYYGAKYEPVPVPDGCSAVTRANPPYPDKPDQIRCHLEAESMLF